MLRDAALCVRVISPPMLQDQGGPGGGLIFWSDESGDNSYDAMISPAGDFAIQKTVKGTNNNVTKGKSSAIKSGANAVNDIKLVNKGNVTTLYINGQKVQDIKAQPGKDATYVGVYAWSETKQLDEWRFADMVMTQPNYGNELTDYGVMPQTSLRADAEIGTPTPTTVPGAKVISTRDLYAAIQRGSLDGASFVMVDALKDNHAKTIRGAKRVPDAGRPGNFDDSVQPRVRSQLMALTKNSLTTPIVFFCEGAAGCWESYNAVLRAQKMGFTRIYWYRGGLTSWSDAGLPMT